MKDPRPDVEEWDVANLDLDPENARLPEDLADRSQLALVAYFEQAYELEELAWSMAEHGYFTEEPLLTVNIDAPGRRVVLEGNRRLATLKLLTDASARDAVKKSFWNELAELASEHQLQKVPTRNYPTRESLLDYLGFRHVSGLLQWTADAKARFVHNLIVNHKYSFDRAGRVIGSRPDAIRRQFIAWRSLEQARSYGIDTAPGTRHFGVYYRALQNPAIRSFIGVDGWINGTESMLNPLKLGGTDRLGEFLDLVFGPKRVIRESRQLDELGKVLANRQAYALLKETRDLSIALQELPADKDALYAAIRLSYRNAARANAEAFQFKGDPDLKAEAAKLRDLVAQLLKSLQ